MYSIYLSTSRFLRLIISNTNKHKFSSKWISYSGDINNHVDCIIKRDVYHQKMYLCSVILFFVLKISVVYQEKIYHRS